MDLVFQDHIDVMVGINNPSSIVNGKQDTIHQGIPVRKRTFQKGKNVRWKHSTIQGTAGEVKVIDVDIVVDISLEENTGTGKGNKVTLGIRTLNGDLKEDDMVLVEDQVEVEVLTVEKI